MMFFLNVNATNLHSKFSSLILDLSFFELLRRSAIRRCIFPPPNGPIHFSDVILADIGTSFARVLGDVWLALWMLKPGNSMLNPPVDDSWLRWILPTVMR